MWHTKVKNALNLLVKDVLNDERALSLTYRRLSLPSLLGVFGHCDVNILAIGQQNSWLINARTSHKKHFVGTKIAIGLTHKATDKTAWRKLEAFVLRYAAPGSSI